MYTPLFLTIGTAALTAGFLFLLLVEQARGVRFFDGIRLALDRGISRLAGALARKTPRVHAGVVRAVFHYLAHVALSAVLGILRRGELLLARVVRLNRAKAIKAAKGTPDAHLREIAEHKESVALSSAEKRKRKNQALRGD